MAELDKRLSDVGPNNDFPGQIRKFFISGINDYAERIEFEVVLVTCGAKVQDFIVHHDIQIVEYFITTHNYYNFLEKLFNTRYSENITFKKVVLKYGKCSKTG